MLSLYDKYVDYQKTYVSKYGPKTVVLMQVGLFHEFFGDITEEIALILCLYTTRKHYQDPMNKDNYSFSGFPSASINRYVDILLAHNYNIIVVDQVNIGPSGSRIISRSVSRIYKQSPNGVIKVNIMNCQLQEEIKQVGIERRCRPGGDLYYDAKDNFDVAIRLQETD